MIQNEFKMIFNAFRFRSRTLSMFSNALKMICNAFERFQNALKWKNGSTEFSLSLVFPNRVTFDESTTFSWTSFTLPTFLQAQST